MRLTNNDINKYRLKFNELHLGTQVIIHENGIFEIYNIKESDLNRIKRLLDSADFIENIHSSESKYDFSNFDFSHGYAKPKSIYDIRGILKEDIDEAAKEKSTYGYSGNVYRFDNCIGKVDYLETRAVSFKQAVNNIIFKAAEEFGYNRAAGANIDIDRDDVFVVDNSDDFEEVELTEPIRKCEICGRELTYSGECPLCDLNDESVLEEAIEKHQELNPKLYDGDKLKPEVKQKLLEIANHFISNLEEDAVDIDVKDIVLVGSNANYNYTSDSDIDLHIIASKKPDCEKNHLDIIYQAYKSNFNNKYDFSIYGIPVEIYVEFEDDKSDNPIDDNKITEVLNINEAVSGGEYSIKDDKWLQEPVAKDIPEIDQELFNAAYFEWEGECKDILEGNDLSAVDSYIDNIYAYRQEGLSKKEGEFSIPNLVFKELRNKGYLDKLKEKKIELEEKEMSLETLEENIVKQNKKWVNKGKEGTHGTFATKKEADAQRKAMFANGYHESIDESFNQLSTNLIKLVTLKYVKENGYMPGAYGYHNNNGTSYRQSPTAAEIYQKLNNSSEEELDEYVSDVSLIDIDRFANNLHPEGNYAEYEQKCLDIWNKNRIEKSDISILASFCNKFFKQQDYENRQAEKARKEAEHEAQVNSTANSWNGEVGDTVEFKVASAEIKTMIYTGSYYGGEYPLWEIKDTEGRVYTWGDTSCKAEIHSGDIIKGKVKALNEFRGIKQTRLTRVTIKDGHSYRGFFADTITEKANVFESQSQEIAHWYEKLSKEYNIDLEKLVYGESGFMKSCYPEGFPDFAGDVIYSEKYWHEFEEWLKDKKGIYLKSESDDEF